MNKAERSWQAALRNSEFGWAIVVAALVILASRLLQQEAPRFPLPPRTVALHSVPIRVDAADVAPLRFVAAWRLAAADPRFGGLSALAIDRGRFLALSDSGVIYRFPVPGLKATVAISELPDGPGPPTLKVNRDSESLARDAAGRGWWVGFETRDQLWLYDQDFRRVIGRIKFGERRWPKNLGLEAILSNRRGLTLVPELAHEVVVLSDGRQISQPLSGVGSNISDMARLPDGEMIVLMRQVTWRGIVTNMGILMKRPGGWRVERRVPLHLGPFANLEGLAVQPLPGGGTRLWLVTDDNFQPPLTTMLFALDVGPGRWPGSAAN